MAYVILWNPRIRPSVRQSVHTITFERLRIFKRNFGNRQVWQKARSSSLMGHVGARQAPESGTLNTKVRPIVTKITGTM